MSIAKVDLVIRWIGGLLAYLTLAVIFVGIWRGTKRQAGRITGNAGNWLRSPWFYLITSAIFFGLCILGWIPLPWSVSPQARIGILMVGVVLFFPGILLVLWGRLALGRNYFVSTGMGAQLFAGQQLFTRGPFAIVRHPMYTGLILAGIGSLFIYFTWTTLLFALFAPMITLRARREEVALAAEFGDEWLNYCKRVPAFFPRFR